MTAHDLILGMALAIGAAMATALAVLALPAVQSVRAARRKTSR